MADQTPSIPKQIGPYSIQSLLKEQTFYTLYLGSHPETKKPLAVKTLNPKWIQNTNVVDRFLKEAEITELSRHRNIVEVYSHGTWEQGYYLAMEFVQGVSLRHFIEESPMSYQHALETVLQVAHALTHMHSKGIIHCDIKPDNILVTTDGRVKVIDFGIAQIYSKFTDSKQASSLFSGSMNYMSPEQKKSSHTPSFSWDLYALGIVGYELLTKQLCQGKFSIERLPKGVQPIFHKMLSIDSKKRYKDVLDLITELSLYLNSPAFQKDAMQLRAMGQDQRQAAREFQNKHLFTPPPNWSKISLGLLHHDTADISGIYYDFLELEDSMRAVILAEAACKGVEALCLMSYLKGAIKSLCPLTNKPNQLMHALNHLLFNDRQFDLPISLTLLILDPATSSFQFSSSGYGPLWQLSAGSSLPELIETNNIALGIDPTADFLQIKHKWEVGDTLFLHTLRASSNKKSQKESAQEKWRNLLIDSLYLDPQQQVEKVYRKLLRGKDPSEVTKPFLILSFQRRH